MYRNLDEFLIRLEQSGELKRIKQQGLSGERIATITTEHIQQDPARNRALWFEHAAGSNFPVITNLLGTSQRMAWALGVDALDHIESRLTKLLDLSTPMTFSSMMSRAGDLLSVLRSSSTMGWGATSEISVQKERLPDLDGLPIMRCWPDETHASIPQVQLITINPASSTRTIQSVSVVKLDRYSLGLELLLPSGTKSLPAALVLGGDPATMWSASVPLPGGIDPYWLAGWLRQRPVPLANSLTQPGLQIPSDAEIVIEGIISPAQHPIEAVIAHHSGHYVRRSLSAIMQVTAISYRPDAVYPLTVPAPPPTEYYPITKATERLFMPLLRLMMDDIIDLYLPAEGVAHNLALVSIRKRYTGHPHQVMYGLWGMNKLALNKLTIVVDEDIDVQNVSEVVRQIISQVDWRRDTVLLDGPVHPYDGAALKPGFGGKLGIDATGKPDRNIPHKTPALNADIICAVFGDNWRIWHDRVIIGAPQQDVNQGTLNAFCPHHDIILVDHEVKLDNLLSTAWQVLSNVDWRRDLTIRGGPIDPYDTSDSSRSTFVLDARIKHQGWPQPICIQTRQ